MQIKTKVDFHNRFEIYKNGEWVGKAENIVLDQMYTRICNFSTYFVNIHFGTGTGTTTPDRTTLFSYLGTKTAATEETIKALPTSSWTRKITLAPEEYVGETLTEVGIAYGSTASYLVTHALITDAEGNTISISKTAIDLIEIYATVFIQLNNSSEVSFVECKFDTSGFGNKLVDYFCGSSMPTTPITVGYSSNPDGKVSTLAKLNEVTPTVTVDITNKKRTYYSRFSVDQGNARISVTEVGLEDILRFLPITNQSVEDVVIGTGDGATTVFELPNGNISNLMVKKDGVEVSYTTHNDNAYVGNVPFSEYIDYNAEYADLQIAGWQCVEYEDFSIYSSSGYKYSKVKESLNGKRMFGTFRGGYSYGSSRLYIYSSVDGINWTERKDVAANSNSYNDWTLDITYDDLYWRMNTSSYSPQHVYFIKIEEPVPTVELTSAPELDTVITASYDVAYFPKTDQYVLDITFELQFGEGV